MRGLLRCCTSPFPLDVSLGGLRSHLEYAKVLPPDSAVRVGGKWPHGAVLDLPIMRFQIEALNSAVSPEPIGPWCTLRTIRCDGWVPCALSVDDSTADRVALPTRAPPSGHLADARLQIAISCACLCSRAFMHAGRRFSDLPIFARA